MLIKNEFLVCKVEVKEGKNGTYLLVNLLDISSGDMFSIAHKNVGDINKFKLMEKMNITVNLISSKYGLNLEIENIEI